MLLSEPTSKLHLQDLLLTVDDVAVWVEGVAGTVHADFQTQIAAWLEAIIYIYVNIDIWEGKLPTLR